MSDIEISDSSFEWVLTACVNRVPCDFYRRDSEVWVIREQIGQALEYANPKKAIEKIHLSHKERFDKCSRLICQVSPNLGSTQETMYYSFKGTLELCQWSKQPKADAVTDALYAAFKRAFTSGMVTTKDSKLLSKQAEANKQQRLLSKEQTKLAVQEVAIAKVNAQIAADTLKITEELSKAVRTNDQFQISAIVGMCEARGVELPEFTYDCGFDMGDEKPTSAVEQCEDGTLHIHMHELVEIGGVSKPLEYWCRKARISRGGLRHRIVVGWSLEDALTKKSNRT